MVQRAGVHAHQHFIRRHVGVGHFDVPKYSRSSVLRKHNGIHNIASRYISIFKLARGSEAVQKLVPAIFAQGSLFDTGEDAP